MRYVKKTDDFLQEYSGPGMGKTWYAVNGWTPYAGTLPPSRLDIIDGVVTELSAPEPTTEIVAKRPFIKAITALLTDEQKSALASDWQTQAWTAQLPGEIVDLLDPDVFAFLAAAGLTIEQIRVQMATAAASSESDTEEA